MKMITILAAALLLTGCGSNKAIVSTPPARCADLVPSEWAQGVEATPIPTDTPVTLGQPLTEALRAAIIAPWAQAYVGMSGQLEKSNGRTSDAMTIQRNCETMVNEARADRQ